MSHAHSACGDYRRRQDQRSCHFFEMSREECRGGHSDCTRRWRCMMHAGQSTRVLRSRSGGPLVCQTRSGAPGTAERAWYGAHVEMSHHPVSPDLKRKMQASTRPRGNRVGLVDAAHGGRLDETRGRLRKTRAPAGPALLCIRKSVADVSVGAGVRLRFLEAVQASQCPPVSVTCWEADRRPEVPT